MDRGRRQQADTRLVLVPASRVAVSDRVRLINEAYAEYYVPLHVNEEQVLRMDQVYDVDLERSVVAFVGTEPVGLSLLGRRSIRGWIHSVGTLPAWRRCGIARAMVAQVIAAAGEAGVEELTLEVFAQNAPACGLYRSLGFRPSRELHTWRRSGDEEPVPIPRQWLVPTEAALLHDLVAAWQAGQSTIRGAESLDTGSDDRPCWQRDVESLKRMGSALTGYTLPSEGSEILYARRRKWVSFDREGDSGVDGCCLVSDAEQTISIMAVSTHPGVDRLACGRALLQALSARYPGQALSMFNIPVDGFLCRILVESGFKVTMQQVELVRYLR